MKFDRIVAVRNNKTVYRSGDLCYKVFDDTFSKANILNEALNQARVEETGLKIPKLHEVGIIDGRWTIVYEFVEGKTLSQLISEDPENKSKYLDRPAGESGSRSNPFVIVSDIDADKLKDLPSVDEAYG